MATVSKRLAIVAILPALGACAPFGAEQTHGMYEAAPQFGEALKYDMAIQTINPDPVYPAGSPEAGTNGDAARAAAERYRKGAVKPIERPSTTDTVTGGSSSGN